MTNHTARVERYNAAGTAGEAPAYTIGTLVTDKNLYAAMIASLQAGGFTAGRCEYLYIDNSASSGTGAYQGLNAILNAAKAPYVILCHQDVRLLTDTCEVLDQRLKQLTEKDPAWAVAGNAGGVCPGKLALRISDPHGENQHTGELPQRVVSLDENFLVVARDARIGFSHDLSGFHFYGADICLHAAHMGRTAYVIDFHLRHLSPGRKNQDFDLAEKAFRSKWSAALKPRWIQTTCALVHISGAPGRSKLGHVIDRPLARLARRLPRARGWTSASREPA